MFALVVAPSPGFLILIYVGLLQEQAIQEEKSVYKSKKTTVCGESFYYSVHDAYAAMLNTLYSGMSGRGASLNSSMLHLVSCWDVET